jgi:hypothetical protein
VGQGHPEGLEIAANGVGRSLVGLAKFFFHGVSFLMSARCRVSSACAKVPEDALQVTQQFA